MDSKSFYKTADICQVQSYHLTKALNQSSIQWINSLELYCDNWLATSVPLIHAGHIQWQIYGGPRDQGTSPPPQEEKRKAGKASKIKSDPSPKPKVWICHWYLCSQHWTGTTLQLRLIIIFLVIDIPRMSLHCNPQCIYEQQICWQWYLAVKFNFQASWKHSHPSSHTN